jgi:biopolymer transport protein ExbB
MIPLVICSIAGVTSAVERFQSLRRARLIPDGFLEGLQATIAGAGGSVEKGKTYCEESNTPAGRICTEGLSRISGGSSEVEKAVETAGNMEMDRLRRSLSIIRLVVVIAPLLGLVGTVYGMIGAFQGVEGAGEATDKATMLSKGIYQALITTAAGLTIAIPLMVVCHFLNAKIDSLSEDFNRLALRFMTILPTGGGGMAGVRAVPSQPVESAPVIGESAGQPTTA